MASFVKDNSRSSGGARRLRIAGSGPFQGLGKVTVVYIGGSRGIDSIMFAKIYPDLSFIAQDLPQTIQGAESGLPPDLRGRIQFQPYDFFTPQTRVAEVYMIKRCFHNWRDDYCVRIIKNQIGAMKRGTKILVMDSLVPPPGTMPLLAERSARAYDMLMLTQTNGREREAEDWKNIFRQADECFKVVKMIPRSMPLDVAPARIIEVV